MSYYRDLLRKDTANRKKNNAAGTGNSGQEQERGEGSGYYRNLLRQDTARRKAQLQAAEEASRKAAQEKRTASSQAAPEGSMLKAGAGTITGAYEAITGRDALIAAEQERERKAAQAENRIALEGNPTMPGVPQIGVPMTIKRIDEEKAGGSDYQKQRAGIQREAVRNLENRVQEIERAAGGNTLLYAGNEEYNALQESLAEKKLELAKTESKYRSLKAQEEQAKQEATPLSEYERRAEAANSAYALAVAERQAYERKYGGNMQLYDLSKYNTLESEEVRMRQVMETAKSDLWTAQRRELFKNAQNAADLDLFSAPDEEKGGKDETWRYINDDKYRAQAEAQSLSYGAARGKLQYSYMTDKEKEAYNYIYNRYGKKTAEDYLEYLTFDLNARQQQKIRQVAEEQLPDNKWASAFASLLSVPANLMSGAGFIDVAAQKAQRDLTGSSKPIDYNRSAQTMYNAAQGTRQGTAEKFKTAGGQFMYQTVMSMADSLGVMGLSLIGVPGTTFLLGGSAATDAMHQAKEAGATDDQAIAMGFLSGAAETVFEEFSLEYFLDWFKSPTPKNIKQVLKNIMLQGAGEGSEEFFTTIANTISEMAVLGDAAEMQRNAKEYIELGATEDEAKRLVVQEWLEGLSLDALGGFVSGGLFGIGGSIAQQGRDVYNRRQQGKNIKSDGNTGLEVLSSHIIENGEKYGAGTVEKAQEIADRIASGDKVSNSMAGQLVELIEADNPEFMKNTWPTLADEIDRRAESAEKEKAVSEDTDSTAVNDNPAEHTAEQQRIIEEYKNAVDEGLKKAFEEYSENPNGKFVRYDISSVSEKQAADMATVIDGDYSGYTNAINTNGIKHILNEHGPHGTTNHSMSDLNDAARIKYVLDNYDSVQQATYASGDVRYSKEFRDSNNKPAQMVVFSKKINGTYFVVEAVPDTKYKKLWIVSAYIDKKGGFTQASDAQGPENTSDTSLASQSPTTTVTQEMEKSKSESNTDRRNEVNKNGTEQIQDSKRSGERGGEDAGGERTADAGASEGVQSHDTEGVRGDNAAGRVYTAGDGQDGAGELRQQDTAINRQNSVRAYGVEPISSQEAGITRGSRSKTVFEMPAELYDNELKTIAADAEKNGLELHVYTGILSLKNGRIVDGYHKNGVIWIKADSNRRTATEAYDHEKFHMAVGRNKGAFAAVANWVKTMDKGRLAGIVEKYVQRYRDAYDLNSMSEDEAFCAVMEEILADAYAGADVFKADATEYTQTSRAIAEELGATKNSEYNRNQGRAPPQGMTYEDVKNAVREVIGELTGNKSGTQTQESGEKYSLNSGFEKAYDNWNQNYPDEHISLFVGYTSEALQSIGVKDQRITWDTGKILKIKKAHPAMTDSVLKQVPQIIENPVLIMRSKQSESRLTMFGEVRDANGVPVLAVLELHPTNKNGIEIDELKIASAYGKDNTQNLINTSDILYIDKNKNRTNQWLRDNRLQLPFSSTTNGSVNSIRDREVKSQEDIDSGKYAISPEADREYLELAKNPEENQDELQTMVDEAARAAGYDSPRLYHGTRSFGFTEFDLSRMDDGRSIFLTSNPEIASTYSGAVGTRKFSEAGVSESIDTMSDAKVVTELNKIAKQNKSSEVYEYEYEFYDDRKKSRLFDSIDSELEALDAELDERIKEYADRMAEDFADKTEKKHRQLVELQQLIERYEYNKLSTPLYMLLHHTDALNGIPGIAELEENIRLRNKLEKANMSGGMIVARGLDGYDIRVMTPDNGRKTLKEYSGLGNYALTAKLGNSLVVDGKGKYWNNLGQGWTKQIEVNEANTYVMEDSGAYYLLRKSDDSVVEGGIVQESERIRKLSDTSIHYLLIQKANNSLRILAENANTTRDIAQWAKNLGYDSVTFKNIKDSGGHNANIASDTDADIYVIFDPQNVKSADTVTYDNDGNVIPLYDRFNSGDGDIRYAISPDLEEELDAVLDGSFNARNNEVVVGTTSDFLVNELGADVLSNTMPARKAYAAMVSEERAKNDGRYDSKLNYHELGIEGLYNALKAAEKPIAAIADATDEKGNKRFDRIVLVTDQQVNGNNIVVVNEVNTKGEIKGKKLQVNKTITAFDNASVYTAIRKAAEDGRLLYLDKKRSQSISAVGPGANSPGVDLRNVDFKTNIDAFWANVKWKKSGAAEYYSGTPGNTAMQDAFEKAFRENAGNEKYALSPEEQQELDNLLPEQRLWEDTANKNMHTYGYTHPELRRYYEAAARQMYLDVIGSLKGTRFGITDSEGYYTGSIGQKRNTTESIANLLDNGGMTYERIATAAQIIADGKWTEEQHRRADVKKVELELDNMLQNGYTDTEGVEVPADWDYINQLEATASGYSALSEYTDHMDEESRFKAAEREELDRINRAVSEEYARAAGVTELTDISDTYSDDGRTDSLGERVSGVEEINRRNYEENKLAEAEELADSEAMAEENRRWERETEERLDYQNAWELAEADRRIKKFVDKAEGVFNMDVDERLKKEGDAATPLEERMGSINDQLYEEKRRQERETATAELIENGAELPEGTTPEAVAEAETTAEIKRANATAAQSAGETPKKSITELEAEWKAKGAAEKSARLEIVERENFEGSRALDKLGIKITGSKAKYFDIEYVRGLVDANSKIIREMNRAIKKLHADPSEKAMAQLIADNQMDARSIPDSMDSARILELADIYGLKRLAQRNVLAEQKHYIKKLNRELAEERFRGAEHKKSIGVQRMNYMTPRRIMIEMFGEQRGREIYNSYFAPVRANEAERTRWADKMMKDAGSITGADGKAGKLSKEERALVQMLIEGKAAAEAVKRMETEAGTRVIELAEKIVSGVTEKKAGSSSEFSAYGDVDRSMTDSEQARMQDRLDKIRQERRTAEELARRRIAEEAINDERYKGVIVDSTKIRNALEYAINGRYYGGVEAALNKSFEGYGERKSKLTPMERELALMMYETRESANVLERMSADDRASMNAIVDDILENGEDAREERRTAEQYAVWLMADRAKTGGKWDGKKIDSVRIDNAVKHFTERYNDMYEAINDFLVAHGTEPIGFIKGYAPHTQPQEALAPLEQIFNWMAAPSDITELRAALAGKTHEFKPYKRWVPNFLSRSGDSVTNYDIYDGYESYIRYVSDVLYHMDDIMRLREASTYLREDYVTNHGKEVLSQIKDMRERGYFEKMKFLEANDRVRPGQTMMGYEIDDAMDRYTEDILKSEEKENAVSSSLVMWLDNYTNLLAGKQNAMDRGLEQRIGRKGIRAANRMVNHLIAVQVVGNMSSSLNQFAQMPLTMAELGPVNTALALKDIITGGGKIKQWALDNDFLATRRGVSVLNFTPTNRVSQILSTPLEYTDYFMSLITARAAYRQGLAAGMSDSAAMKYSVQKSENIMGSRAKGTKPVAFDTKNPIMRLVNAYQIEALNQWEHIGRDMPLHIREIARTKGIKAAAGEAAKELVQYLIYAFLINRLCEATYGGTPAPLDLIGITGSFVAAGNGFTLNEGLIRWINGVFHSEVLKENHDFDAIREKNFADGFDWKAAWDDLKYSASTEIPLVSNMLAALGLTDDKTVFGSTVSDTKKYIKGMTEAIGEKNVGESLYNAMLGLSEWFYGGREVQKAVEGIRALRNNAGVTGSGKLSYPVEATAGTVANGVLFGKNALPGVQDYYAAGGSPMSDKNAELYRALVSAGEKPGDMYNVIHKLSGITGDKNEAGETIKGSAGLKKMQYIEELDISEEAKNILFANVITDAASENYEEYEIAKSGVKEEDWAMCYFYWIGLSGDDKKEQFRTYLKEEGYTNAQIQAIMKACGYKK